MIQLTGYHYHNADQTNQTRKFVIDTLVKALEEGTVKLPDGYDAETKKLTGELIDVPIKDWGSAGLGWCGQAAEAGVDRPRCRS